MNKLFLCLAIVASVLAGGCSRLTITEGVLSNGTPIAAIETPGDGITPPTTTLVIADRNGGVTPINTAASEGVLPSALKGAVAGIAVGAGTAGAGALLRPANTTVANTSNVDVRTRASASPVNINSARARGGNGGTGLGFGGTGVGYGGNALGIGVGVSSASASSSGSVPNPD